MRSFAIRVVAVEKGAAEGQVAIAVVVRRCRSHGRVLIGGIAGVVDGARRCRRIEPPVIRNSIGPESAIF